MAKYSQYGAAAGTVKEVLPIFLIFSKRAGDEPTRIIMQNAMIRRQPARDAVASKQFGGETSNVSS